MGVGGLRPGAPPRGCNGPAGPVRTQQGACAFEVAGSYHAASEFELVCVLRARVLLHINSNPDRVLKLLRLLVPVGRVFLCRHHPLPSAHFFLNFGFERTLEHFSGER